MAGRASRLFGIEQQVLQWYIYNYHYIYPYIVRAETTPNVAAGFNFFSMRKCHNLIKRLNDWLARRDGRLILKGNVPRLNRTILFTHTVNTHYGLLNGQNWKSSCPAICFTNSNCLQLLLFVPSSVVNVPIYYSYLHTLLITADCNRLDSD